MRDEFEPEEQDRMTRKEDVVSAINLLIHAKDFAARVKELEEVIDRWEERPMIYSGHLMVLNALLDVGLEDREAFNRLIRLADERRKLIPAMKRVDYQRDLMRERRARIAKAIELQELRLGAMDRIAKEKFTKDIQARWRKARDEHIKKLGKLDWKQRNDAASEFWTMIDSNLETSIRQAQESKLKKP